MNEARPRWAWLLIPHVGLIVLATVLAALGRVPTQLFQRHNLDKVGHFVAYGGLAFLAVPFFGRARWRRTLLALAALATLEELSQRFFPARSVAAADLAASLAGIALLGLLAAAWPRYCPRRE
jgi:VanZ family protein